MLGSILGMTYLALLLVVYYVLWKREENRTKRNIQKHLDELKKQHVGD